MSYQNTKSTLQAQGNLLRSQITRFRSAAWVDLAVVLAGLALAVALRYSLLEFKSLDFYASLKPWYNTIKSEGFAAFATGFSTYNPPYLYLLYLIARFIPDAPAVLAVKLPALIADLLCAVMIFRIVRLTNGRSHAIPAVAAMVFLFAPSVVINSAFWGQADSLYTGGILVCVYFLMTRRPAWAMLAFGIALAFKLQAIFLTPLLLALAFRGTLPWKWLLLIPAALIVAVTPAWIAGRPISELANVYAYQASQFEFITMNAASAFAWLPGSKQVFNLFYAPGVIMGAAVGFAWFVVVYKSPRALEAPLLLEAALVCTLIVPFFLPKMHDRYFYPADVLSIALAFFYPRLFYVPILVGGASFLAYQPFLFERDLVPLPVLAAVLLLAIGCLSYDTVKQLYSSRGGLPDRGPHAPTHGIHPRPTRLANE